MKYNIKSENIIKIQDGLLYCDFRESSGPAVVGGDVVKVHYKVAKSLEDIENDIFLDSSWTNNSPIIFTVGKGEVIYGLDLGIIGLKVLGYRLLIVPPALGFAEIGVPNLVDANATLVYELYLIERLDNLD